MLRRISSTQPPAEGRRRRSITGNSSRKRRPNCRKPSATLRSRRRWPPSPARSAAAGSRAESRTMDLHLSTWEEIEAYLKRSKGIILPVGSTEQHGPNGLIGTDWICAQAISRGVGEKTGALVGPTINVGMAQHHLAFTGSMTLRPSTLIALIHDYVTSLARHGFERFYFINGHGGNIATVTAAFSEVYATASMRPGTNAPSVRCRLKNWWEGPGVKSLSKELFGDREGSHATPSEVSVTFYVHPEAIKKREMAPMGPKGRDFADADDYRRLFLTGGSAPTPRSPRPSTASASSRRLSTTSARTISTSSVRRERGTERSRPRVAHRTHPRGDLARDRDLGIRRLAAALRAWLHQARQLDHHDRTGREAARDEDRGLRSGLRGTPRGAGIPPAEHLADCRDRPRADRLGLREARQDQHPRCIPRGAAAAARRRDQRRAQPHGGVAPAPGRLEQARRRPARRLRGDRRRHPPACRVRAAVVGRRGGRSRSRGAPGRAALPPLHHHRADAARPRLRPCGNPRAHALGPDPWCDARLVAGGED